MLFSAILICPHFLCGQVGFGRGIKPRRHTGTLTLRFAVARLPFGSCNSGYKLHGIFNAVRPSANGRFVPPSSAGTSCPRSCHVGMNLGFWPPLHIAAERYLNLFFDPLVFGSKLLIVDKPPGPLSSGRLRICKIHGSEIAASHILENLLN